jgi:hypothetical protein
MMTLDPPTLCQRGVHLWRRSGADPHLRRCRRRYCHATRGRGGETDAWFRAVPAGTHHWRAVLRRFLAAVVNRRETARR